MRRPSEHLSFPLVGWLVALLALGSADPAQATSLTGDNPLGVEAITEGGGVFSWQARGRDRFGQQWFWYRIGPTTTPPSPDLYLALLKTNVHSAEAPFVNRTNPLDFHFYPYSDYAPAMAASSTSAKGLSVVKDASENTSLPFHFYQYSYFNLDDSKASPAASFFDSGRRFTAPQHAGAGSTHAASAGSEQHFFADSANYRSAVDFSTNSAFRFRSATVPIVKHKANGLFDAPTEQPPPRLSISAGPNSTFLLNTTTPGRLQSTMLINGADTIWQDEGPISNTLSITPLPSQPSVFYRLLPP